MGEVSLQKGFPYSRSISSLAVILFLSIAGLGAAGVAGGLGAILAGSGLTLYKILETEEKNVVLTDFVDSNYELKGLVDKISEDLQTIDASKLRSALADIDEVASVTIDAKHLEYYLGEVLAMSKQNLAEVEDIIKSLTAMFGKS